MQRTPMDRKTELNEAVLQIFITHGRRLRAEAFGAALRTTAQLLARLGQAVGSGALSLANRFRAWRQRRLAIAELLALDDRTLRDIGLGRGDVANLVSQLRQGVPVERAAARAEVVRLPRARAETDRPGKMAA